MKKSLLCLFFLLFTISAFCQTNKYVTASALNLRNKPNSKSTIINKLNKGEKIAIIDGIEVDGWVKAIVGLDTGYVYSRYLSDTPPSKQATAVARTQSYISQLATSAYKRKSDNNGQCEYNGHPLYVGKRGGCYYMSGNSKEYVDRSYCNSCR